LQVRLRLEQVKKYTKNIIFIVQDALFELIEANSKHLGIKVYSETTTNLEKLEFDYHIPLVSIASILQIDKNNIPHSSGYIKANENMFVR